MDLLKNWILVLTIACYLNAQNSDSKFNIKKVYTYEGDTIKVNGSFMIAINNRSLKNEETSVTCRMNHTRVGVILNLNDTVTSTDSNSSSKLEYDITVKGLRLGGSHLTCAVATINNSKTIYSEEIAELIVKRRKSIAELIFRITVTIFVLILTFVMGCGLDMKIIWGYIKKPISPFIGFCSQFIFMPLIAAGLAKFTKIESAFGLGLLVIGCSPGGGASNVWTILFEGDLNLSMTMTFVSTCAALGMMPFWLFVLGRLFIDPDDVVIPYSSIALNLLQLVVPASMGIVFRWKCETYAIKLMKKVKFMALLFIIFILTFGTYANFSIYLLLLDYAILIPIAAMLPWLGFIFGLVFSLITRRNRAQTVAIVLETGFQNIGIAILILMYSMPQPDGDLGSLMPLIVAPFTPIPLYILLIIRTIRKKCFSHRNKEKNIEINLSLDEQKNQLLKESLSCENK